MNVVKAAATKKKTVPSRQRKIDPWDVEFGKRLAKARGKLTQQDMADYLKIPLNTYQKYENGKRSFPKDLIERVVTKTLHGPWLLLTGHPDYLCPAYPAQPRAQLEVVRR